MMRNSPQPPENLPENLPLSDQPSQSIEHEPAQPAESKTREYLSNERTYLSWMRSAISLLGISAILGRIHSIRLLALGSESTWQLGVIFAVVGLITAFLATQHYLAVRRDLADDSAKTTERWIVIVSIVVILIGSSITYYVLSYTLS